MVTIAAAMAVEAQVPVLGRDLGGLAPELIGALAMATPAGSIIALTFIPTDGPDREVYYRNLAISLGAALVAAILIGFGSEPVALFGAFFVLGFVYQTSMTSNIIVGKRIPADRRAVVFGMLQALIIISNGVGAWLGGLAIEVVGVSRGAQLSLVISLVALFAIIPKDTRRVLAGPTAPTTESGEELTIDLSDHSSLVK